MSALPGNHEGLVTFTSDGNLGPDNANFFNVIGNSIRVKNVVKIAPRMTLIPNLFTNVSSALGNNTFTVSSSDGVTSRTFIIPEGRYSVFQLMVTLNTLTYNTFFDVNILWQPATAFDGTQRINALSNPSVPLAAGPTYLTWPQDSGFPRLIGAGNVLQSAIPPYQPFVFPAEPVMLSVPFVHVVCPEIAGNAHIDEKGRSHSVLETVDFTDVQYGQYGRQRNDTAELCSVDFDFPVDFSKVNFYIVAPNYRPLSLPSGGVYIQCRIWSADK